MQELLGSSTIVCPFGTRQQHDLASLGLLGESARDGGKTQPKSCRPETCAPSQCCPTRIPQCTASQEPKQAAANDAHPHHPFSTCSSMCPCSHRPEWKRRAMGLVARLVGRLAGLAPKPSDAWDTTLDTEPRCLCFFKQFGATSLAACSPRWRWTSTCPCALIRGCGHSDRRGTIAPATVASANREAHSSNASPASSACETSPEFTRHALLLLCGAEATTFAVNEWVDEASQMSIKAVTLDMQLNAMWNSGLLLRWYSLRPKRSGCIKSSAVPGSMKHRVAACGRDLLPNSVWCSSVPLKVVTLLEAFPQMSCTCFALPTCVFCLVPSLQQNVIWWTGNTGHCARSGRVCPHHMWCGHGTKRLLHPMRGLRVGEATQPGPDDPLSPLQVRRRIMMKSPRPASAPPTPMSVPDTLIDSQTSSGMRAPDTHPSSELRKLLRLSLHRQTGKACLLSCAMISTASLLGDGKSEANHL